MSSASIVIPIYQSAATLRRSLDSISQHVSRQIYELEVIAVLDGDDQHCLTILEEWCAGNTLRTRIEIMPKLGVAAARNRGVELSQAENIAFLDSDDEITPQRLNWMFSDLRGELLVGKQEVILESGIEYAAGLLHPSDFHLMSFIMNRLDFIKLGGFAAEYSAGTEWDLAIRASDAGLKVRKIDQVFVKRYIHSGNASHMNSLVKDEHLKAIREHIQRKRMN